MKILKKPKILPCECKVCGAVFQPNWKIIKSSSWLDPKEIVCCPFCGKINVVKFEKGGADNER